MGHLTHESNVGDLWRDKTGLPETLTLTARHQDKSGVYLSLSASDPILARGERR